MHITDIISGYIVHHDPLVEGMKSENSILPPLLLPSQIVGVKATILENRCCILGGRNGEDRGLTDTGGCDRGGHGWLPSLSRVYGLYVS